MVKGYHFKPVDISLHIFFLYSVFSNRHFLTDCQHQQFPKFSDSMKIFFLSFRTQKKNNYFFPSEYLGELQYISHSMTQGQQVLTNLP